MSEKTELPTPKEYQSQIELKTAELKEIAKKKLEALKRGGK